MKNVKISVATILLLSATTGFAKEQHGSHEHGKAQLNVAIDSLKVMIAFESPADSIYGFEHEAKAAKDVAARDTAVKVLKYNAASLFQFQGDRGCALTTSTIEPWVIEGDDDHDHDTNTNTNSKTKAKAAKGKVKESKHGHGEVHASYTFTCAKAPAGSKLTVTLTDSFTRLRQIAVQLISDQKQSGTTITSSNKTLDL